MLPGCCQWGKFLLLVWNEATGWKPGALLVFSFGLIGITVNPHRPEACATETILVLASCGDLKLARIGPLAQGQ